jgi:hypothetical protein
MDSETNLGQPYTCGRKGNESAQNSNRKSRNSRVGKGRRRERGDRPNRVGDQEEETQMT